MRHRAFVLSLCGVLAVGVVAAPAASAGPTDCVDQLVADLNSAPIPDPTSLVTVEGLNVHVNTDGTEAFAAHVTAAATRFALCSIPNPADVLACAGALSTDIVQSILNQQVDEINLRYVHLHDGGVSVYGETAVADALTAAGCL